MKEPKLFADGKWRSKGSLRIVADDKDEQPIALMCALSGNGKWGLLHANADMIAAAPKVARMLNQVLSRFEEIQMKNEETSYFGDIGLAEDIHHIRETLKLAGYTESPTTRP